MRVYNEVKTSRFSFFILLTAIQGSKKDFFSLCEERAADLQYYIPLYTFANKKYHYCIHTSDKSARK